jgi:hypothetical protein
MRQRAFLLRKRQFGGNRYAILDRIGHGAEIRMGGVGLFGLGSAVLFYPEAIGHMDGGNPQHAAVVDNFAPDIRPDVAFPGRDPLCRQSRGKRAQQSSPGGGDQIIQGGRMRINDVDIDSVVRGDFGM